jgi:hypothetical protein
MDLSVQGLIDSIKLDGTLPDGMFNDSDFVKFLNEAYYTDVMAFIMKHREDYFLTYTDYPPTNSILIPSNAVGNKLNDVVTIDSSGNLLSNLPRISRNEIIKGNTRMKGFYVEGNYIKFMPLDNSDRIRLYYYQRPFYLDSPENIATVISWDSDLELANVDQVPDWISFPISCTVTSFEQPYLVTSNSITNASTTNLTISLAEVSAGDYICRSGYRAIADIPLEVREVLIQAAILKAMVAIKDKDGVKLVGESLAMAKDNASTILTPRVDNEVRKVVPQRGIWRR